MGSGEGPAPLSLLAAETDRLPTLVHRPLPASIQTCTGAGAERGGCSLLSPHSPQTSPRPLHPCGVTGVGRASAPSLLAVTHRTLPAGGRGCGPRTPPSPGPPRSPRRRPPRPCPPSEKHPMFQVTLTWPPASHPSSDWAQRCRRGSLSLWATPRGPKPGFTPPTWRPRPTAS